jgi:Tol biopolymer transport system component
MKFIIRVILLVVCFSFLAGCNEGTENSTGDLNEEIKNTGDQLPSNGNTEETKQLSDTEFDNLMASTSYYKNPYEIRAIEQKHEIDLEKVKISADEKTINVKWQDGSIQIPSPNDYHGIAYAALSSDQKYLSIEVSQLEGDKVFFVNLESKEVESIFPTEEVVSNPIWSPQGHSLAFSKGRNAGINVVIFEELDSKQQNILSE